ncbi:MAG TPA: outer membrane beta-barrel protein [Candidatus Rubrimentiphilum sp.]|nr:outer membrane beta-barrel protein [Candidatus Rubrimentiphilum sp.]
MSLSRILIAVCVLLLGLSGRAYAQATDDFKGFYVGATVGGAQIHSNPSTTTTFSPTGYFANSSPVAIGQIGQQPVTATGFTGGVQAGYNFQFSHFVFGLEADYNTMNLSGTKTATNFYPCCPPPNNTFTITQTVSTTGLFTGRARLGIANGHYLAYITGGVASATVNYTAVFTDTFATAHENGGYNATRSGSVFGFGAEDKINPKVTLKGEYLFANFGTLSSTSTNLTAFTPPIAFPTNVFTHSAGLSASLVRFGVNFHF